MLPVGDDGVGVTVCEDDERDGDRGGEEVEMVQLSPDVQCYRKGRGPRRDRCGSYWDRDVIKMGKLGM